MTHEFYSETGILFLADGTKIDVSFNGEIPPGLLRTRIAHILMRTFDQGESHLNKGTVSRITSTLRLKLDEIERDTL